MSTNYRSRIVGIVALSKFKGTLTRHPLLNFVSDAIKVRHYWLSMVSPNQALLRQ